MTVSVLGTEYSIEQKDEREDELLEQYEGYCDKTCKKIVVGRLRPEKGSSVNTEPEQKRLLRHELIHAFLFESGLDENSEWGTDETLVDWIAIQFPKMEAAFEKTGCI